MSTTSYCKNNEDYYDNIDIDKIKIDPPHAVELARRSARAFRKVYEFDEDETVLMDFACGVGLLSRELIPYAKCIVGVDISQKMVDEYNHRVENQGINLDEMRAVRLDILDPSSISNSNGLLKMEETFDLVVCNASYHHFDNITEMTKALLRFLKPGGTLLVIDLLKEEDSNIDIDNLFPEHGTHLVAHQGGFTVGDVKEAFTMGSLINVSIGEAIKAKKKGYPVTLFIAGGIKP